MSISAVNSIPIKPQASFGKSEREKFNEITDYTDKINNQYIKSDDIKKPAAVGLAVLTAAAVPYAGAKGITNFVTKKIAPNAGIVVEKYLQSGANAVKTKAETLAGSAADESFTTLKKYSGKVLGKAEDIARNIYTTIAYSPIKKEVVNPERANAALGNVIGTGLAAATVVDICKTDSNGDGINDIMQKSQNAITRNKVSYDSAFEAVNVLNKAAEVLA